MKTISYQSKTKFLTFLLILTTSLFLLDKYKQNTKIKRFVNDSIKPFITYTHIATTHIKKTLWSFFHFYSLKKENEKLKKQITSFNNRSYTLENLNIENKRLKKLLSFKDNLDFRVTTAKVIGSNFSNWYNSIIINKGEIDGITSDQAVFSPTGIVGKVVSTSKKTAKIMILTNRSSKVGGRIHRTRELGMLIGINKNYCILNFLPRNAEVQKGDLVVTPGFGNIFPEGFILGVVAKVYSTDSKESEANEYAKDFGLYKQAKVIPTVDFSTLEEVLVINKKIAEK